jgi:hypothetical protein
MPGRTLAPASAYEEAAPTQALLLAVQELRSVVFLKDEGSLASVRDALWFLMCCPLNFAPVALRHGWGRAARNQKETTKKAAT